MVLGYDLGHYPITYDFVYWLVKAEEARIAAGEDTLAIVIQPGEHDGFRLRTVRDFQLTTERKRWRLENLIVPLANRVSSVASVTVSPIRMNIPTPKFNIFDAIHRNPLTPFQASLAAKAAIQAMHPYPFVAITLRESDIQPTRNSRVSHWIKIAGWLRRKGFRAVFVPDTEAVLQGQVWDGPEDVCVPAALNLDLRLALYEMAQFCCFTSGGPMTLAQFDANIRYATFKLLCTDEAACTPEHLEAIGMPDGASRGEHRNVYWCDDIYPNVVERLDSYTNIHYPSNVADVLRAQTHYRGQLIQPVSHA